VIGSSNISPSPITIKVGYMDSMKQRNRFNPTAKKLKRAIVNNESKDAVYYNGPLKAFSSPPYEYSELNSKSPVTSNNGNF
jgi:hypothetical protein